MALDLTAFNPILKELYKGQKVKDLVYPDHPFFAMLNKAEDFEGDLYPLPLKFANNQAIGHDFAIAQANGGSSKYRAFHLTREEKYGFATIGGQVARASKSNKGAFMAALKSEIDNTKMGVIASLSADLFGDGTGDLGEVISTYASSTTFGLENPEDIAKFEVGMEITFGTDADSATITNRNEILGQLTIDSVTDTGIAASAKIYRSGDKDNVISGLDAWLTPSGSALFGVTRSVDPSRLGGIHYNGSSNAVTYGGVSLPANSDGTIEKTLINGASRLQREGGRPTDIVLSFTDFAKFDNELGTKVEYVRVKPADASDGFVGFESLHVRTSKGVIRVWADAHCKEGIAYALDMKTWVLASLGPAPMIDDLDGNMILRVHNADQVQSRIIFYGNLGCMAPGHNARIILP